jgi:hypothetical protein
MRHHKRSPGVQAPARVRGRCAGLGSAPARPGSARCAGEQVWLIPCCKLLANREFKLAAPSQHRRQPGRGGAGSCRGNPANLGAGCSPPPHALSGKPCPAATGLARVRQPRRIKQIVPARASASSAQITHSGALFTNGPQIPLTVHIGGSVRADVDGRRLPSVPVLGPIRRHDPYLCQALAQTRAVAGAYSLRAGGLHGASAVLAGPREGARPGGTIGWGGAMA